MQPDKTVERGAHLSLDNCRNRLELRTAKLDMNKHLLLLLVEGSTWNRQLDTVGTAGPHEETAALNYGCTEGLGRGKPADLGQGDHNCLEDFVIKY